MESSIPGLIGIIVVVGVLLYFFWSKIKGKAKKESDEFKDRYR